MTTFDPWGKEAPPEDPWEEPAKPGDDEADAMLEEVRFNTAVSRKVYDLKIADAARRRITREQQGELQRPTLIRLDKFLAIEDQRTFYRVDRLWPTGGRVLLTARGKAGKSTIVGNLLRSLVDGHPFLDSFHAQPATRVILIDDELDPSLLRHWLHKQGIENQAAVELLTLRGCVSTFDILDPVARAGWAKEMAGADVIILDCLRPILDAFGLDENHEAGRLLVMFDALLRESGATEAIIVHHMGHGPERARGDSRLADWPDATWKLVLGKDEEDDTLDEFDGPRFFSAYGRDVKHPQTELHYDEDSRRLTLSNHTGNRQQVTTQRKTVRTDEMVMSVVSAEPGLNKRKLRLLCANRGGHNPDTDAAVERLVALGLIVRVFVGQGHLHYPGDAAETLGVPTGAHTVPVDVGTGVPVPLGTAHTVTPVTAPTQKTGHGPDEQTAKLCPGVGDGPCGAPIEAELNRCTSCTYKYAQSIRQIR